jgi:hypothetical protein
MVSTAETAGRTYITKTIKKCFGYLTSEINQEKIIDIKLFNNHTGRKRTKIIPGTLSIYV